MRTRQYEPKQKWHRARHGLALIATWTIAASQLVFASSAEEEFGLMLNLSALEHYRSDKQWCEENYPEFKEKNETAFRASVFSQMTGEEFITSNTTGDLRQKLLADLPIFRTDMRDAYTKSPPQHLKQMCSLYALDIGKQPLRNAGSLKRNP